MTLINKEAAMLRTAFEAAARGAKPGDSYTEAVVAAVATLYPSEAEKFVAALDILMAAANEVVACRQDDSARVERQRAADRVAAFADRFESVEGRANNLIDDYDTGQKLLLSDLRLLVQAAPSLPPKWSAPLADPEVYIVQKTSEDRTDAAARARDVLSVLEARGSEADVFRDGLVGLTAADLETLCNSDDDILFVSFDKDRAAALAVEKRATLTWKTVKR